MPVNGNTSLIRVPKMDRDSVSQVADEHITKILCDTVLPYISSVAHYTSMSDCIEKPLHWIEKRYVMNHTNKELYDEETLQFKQRLSRIIVRKRTTGGLQKTKKNDHGLKFTFLKELRKLIILKNKIKKTGLVLSGLLLFMIFFPLAEFNIDCPMAATDPDGNEACITIKSFLWHTVILPVRYLIFF